MDPVYFTIKLRTSICFVTFIPCKRFVYPRPINSNLIFLYDLFLIRYMSRNTGFVVKSVLCKCGSCGVSPYYGYVNIQRQGRVQGGSVA